MEEERQKEETNGKRKTGEEHIGTDAKRIKSDNDMVDDETPALLQCRCVLLHRDGSLPTARIEVQFLWIDGLDKQAMLGLMQYLKNRLK